MVKEIYVKVTLDDGNTEKKTFGDEPFVGEIAKYIANFGNYFIGCLIHPSDVKYEAGKMNVDLSNDEAENLLSKNIKKIEGRLLGHFWDMIKHTIRNR